MANPDGRIEVLYFDGTRPCSDRLNPAQFKTIRCAELREQVAQPPTVRVDGYDIEPGADDERTDYGLKCRLYRTESGMQGEPPTDWVLAALGLAASSGEPPGSQG